MGRVGAVGRRDEVVVGVVGVDHHREAELFHLAEGGGLFGGELGLGKDGKENGGQDGDDGDDDQKLDEGECGAAKVHA